MKLRLFEIVTDKDKTDIDKMVNILKNKDSIRDYAYILHDKDNTRDHYHIAVRLKDSYDTKYISQWFSIEDNFINKVKGRWSDMLKYLIHENAPSKYQYSDDDVISNFDWKKEKDINGRLNEIIIGIDNGSIREYNYFQYISIVEYNKYKKSIDNAFKYRIDKMKGVNRDMQAIFITGDSGVGKTTYAKEVAESKDYSVFVSSGSNDVLDGYEGQDCIILDDLRPSSMGLADLLKMLDNYTACTVKSRYKNKVLFCKLIIITTVLDIDTFFKNVFSDDIETSIQLKRRCTMKIRMTKDKVYTSLWQNKSRVYSKEWELDNPIKTKYLSRDMTPEEQLNYIQNLLGGVQGMAKDIKDNIDEYVSNEDMEQIKLNIKTPFDK